MCLSAIGFIITFRLKINQLEESTLKTQDGGAQVSHLVEHVPMRCPYWSGSSISAFPLCTVLSDEALKNNVQHV